MKKKHTIGIFLILGISAFWACTPADKEQTTAQDDSAALGRAIHERVLTLDAHIDIEVSFLTPVDFLGKQHEKLVSLAGLKKGGVDAIFFSVYTEQGPRTPGDYERVFEQAKNKYALIRKKIKDEYSADFGLGLSPAEVIRLNTAGKKVALIGMENGYPLGENIKNVELFYDLGCRYITLCHNGHNQLCDSHTGNDGPAYEYNGLSDFGAQVLAEMNRLGIIIDISHLSKKSMLDVLRLSQTPVIASHAGCRALCDVSRNLDDEQLLALKANGGVIHIVGINMFIGPDAAVSDLVDHIDHAVRLMGIDHVGISSDFYTAAYCLKDWKNAGDTPNLTLELVRRGYTEEDIARLWSGNLLRVWRDVEKTATAISD